MQLTEATHGRVVIQLHYTAALLTVTNGATPKAETQIKTICIHFHGFVFRAPVGSDLAAQTHMDSPPQEMRGAPAGY